MSRVVEPDGQKRGNPESEKERLAEEEKRIGAERRGNGIVAVTVPAEQVFEGQSLFADIFRQVFGPAAETEAWKECAKCGRTTSTPVAEGDPVWLVSRLITEFVKEPRKQLCHCCLSGLYERLGRCVQANWQRILKSKSF